MNKPWSPFDLNETVNTTGGLIKQARLAWRLLRDGRVPGWVKLIPVAGLIYLISPIDLIPDLMLPGVGELDDLAILLLAFKMFIELSPPGLVREHLESLLGKKGRAQTARSGETVDASYIVRDTNKE